MGSNFFEEINLVTPGSNHGWPCLENDITLAFYEGSTDCVNFYASPPAGLSFPLHAFARGSGAAVIGGVFKEGPPRYPAEFEGAYFFGEFVSGEVRTLRIEPGVPFDPASVQVVATVSDPVHFELGPDGYVYYLSIFDGQIARLVNTSVNVPPVARAEAVPIAGLPPLSVDFSSDGTSDSNDDPVTLLWDFGDGEFSTDSNPSHLYVAVGTYSVTLSATDPDLAVGTDVVTIHVGKEAPFIEILAPADGFIYEAGEPLQFRAQAIDPEDGLLAETNVRWTVRLNHCVTDGADTECHAHPFEEQSGNVLNLQGPDHGDPGGGDVYFLNATFAAVDSDGIVSSESIQVGPDTDADGCMDLYESELVATAPFLNEDDGFKFEDAGASVTSGHASGADGSAQHFVSADVPPLGTGAGVAYSRLSGEFQAIAGEKHLITFDADILGFLGVEPAPHSATVRAFVSGQIVDVVSATPVVVQPLADHEFTFDSAGPPFGQAIGDEGRRWNFVADLAPGNYVWVLESVATLSAAADAASNIEATVGIITTLHSAQVCSQKIPDSALP